VYLESLEGQAYSGIFRYAAEQGHRKRYSFDQLIRGYQNNSILTKLIILGGKLFLECPTLFLMMKRPLSNPLSHAKPIAAKNVPTAVKAPDRRLSNYGFKKQQNNNRRIY
jgi:hypothetical protein